MGKKAPFSVILLYVGFTWTQTKC